MSFCELSQRLSRACLGKMIILVYNGIAIAFSYLVDVVLLDIADGLLRLLDQRRHLRELRLHPDLALRDLLRKCVTSVSAFPMLAPSLSWYGVF